MARHLSSSTLKIPVICCRSGSAPRKSLFATSNSLNGTRSHLTRLPREGRHIAPGRLFSLCRARSKRQAVNALKLPKYPIFHTRPHFLRGRLTSTCAMLV